VSDRQDLADFCLRQLGGGVINVEISDDQIEDCIQQSIQYYQEYHYDGIERDYVSLLIHPTVLKLTLITGFAINDTVTTPDGASALVIAVDVPNSTISTSTNRGTAFARGQTITNGTVTTTIGPLAADVSLGEMDLRYFELDGSIYNVIKIINTSSLMGGRSGDMFGLQYQLLAPEIINMVKSGAGTGGGIGYFYGLMKYLGDLDFVLSKQKSFRFNRRMNKLFLDINLDNELQIGDYVVIEAYRAVDPETYNEVYEDMWLRKYTTALFKRMWGSNLKKYSGVQLPGGITYNGQVIYDEAVIEIATLEKQLENLQPLLFMVG
jgi:hypothetical protein